jgi:hypothetical protein
VEKRSFCENVCPNRIKCELSGLDLKNKFQRLHVNLNFQDLAEELDKAGCLGVDEYYYNLWEKNKWPNRNSQK